MEKYRLLKNEATADIAFLAYGKTINELFEHVATALSNIMILNIKNSGKIKLKFTVKNPNLEYLLVDFINKIILYKDYKKVIITDSRISIKKGFVLSCNANAEKLENIKNRFIVDIKAATLHDLQIKKQKGLIRCKVVLDI
jgi:SHS2 domain-containing protein